jgi:hypothetical protein
MRTIWRSLAWKEWHEHKWKLASFVAVMCGVAAVCLWYARGDLRADEAVRAMLVASAVPLALFLGLATATGERSRGTLPFLQSLPVSMWRVAIPKLLAGLATLAVAATLTLALLYFACFGLESLGVGYLAEPRDPSSAAEWFEAALWLLSAAAGLYIWSAAVGVNRKDEVSAGAVVAAVLVGLGCLLFLIVECIRAFSGHGPGPLASALVAGIAPLGFLAIFEVAGKSVMALWLGIAVAVVVHLSLAAWYIGRFGRAANREVRSPRPAVHDAGRVDWLAPPRRLPLTAIAWKQCRESLPIVLGGLLCIVGMTLMVVFFNWPDINRWEGLLDVVVGVCGIFGAFLALVFGVATFFYDVEPHANEFWRSRPIGPNQWFAVKFATGLATFLATVYLPLLTVAALSHSFRWLTETRDGILIPPMHLALFAATAAMMCLVRQAIYAVVLGMAAVYVEVLAYTGIVLLAGKLFGWNVWAVSTPSDLSVGQVAIGLVVGFFISTLLAWLAVRRDWGWKR